MNTISWIVFSLITGTSGGVGLYLAYSMGKHAGMMEGIEEGRQFEKDLQTHIRQIKKETSCRIK